MTIVSRPEKASPIQSRARATRAALLSAVERIVIAQGAAAVTTTSISAAGGVSVGTIYRYFEDRNAMLLAAYDASVARIVRHCAIEMERFPGDLPLEQAALRLLSLYLTTADADPAHPGLLKAMRSIRPVDADQGGGNEVSITHDLIAPFLTRHIGSAGPQPAILHFLNVLLGTLVDLYLVTPQGPDRSSIREEIEAHTLLALARLARIEKK